MGCGRVDLIQLYDLARGNLVGVRQRELEAHLVGCRLCKEDFDKLKSLLSTMQKIGKSTDVAPSPKLLKRLGEAMLEAASDFAGSKARNLWTPQQDRPAARQTTRKVSPAGRFAGKFMKWMAVVLLVLVACAAAAAVGFRKGVKKELVWKGLDKLPAHPLVSKALGIADRYEISRIMNALPDADKAAGARLEDASRWAEHSGAPVLDTEFLALAAKCVLSGFGRSDPDVLKAARAVWQRAESAPFADSMGIISRGNEMLAAFLDGNAGKARHIAAGILAEETTEGGTPPPSGVDGASGVGPTDEDGGGETAGPGDEIPPGAETPVE
ncbi:MAG: hypothetical protein JW909_04840 [Planctomycetes bacterium]|nr:hypothetical protein [Planctomycetota bacterium]